jgi:hypothetical protein
MSTISSSVAVGVTALHPGPASDVGGLRWVFCLFVYYYYHYFFIFFHRATRGGTSLARGAMPPRAPCWLRAWICIDSCY